MIHKLINHWNERPSAFLQNPCASDLKLNKCAIIRRHLCFFSNPDFTQLQFKLSSLMAHRLPKLCLRGRRWKGIPGKYVVFIDFFYWNVQLSPVQFYQMPKFLLFPHPSTLRRGEGLCKFIGGSSSLRGLWGFSHFKRPENKSKWRMVENIPILKKTFALAHSMPSSVTFIETEPPLWTGYRKSRNLRIRDLNEI